MQARNQVIMCSADTTIIKRCDEGSKKHALNSIPNNIRFSNTNIEGWCQLQSLNSEYPDYKKNKK
jgi:hypothetical protein